MNNTQIPTTVIYHSADFDGLFCHQIARKFLPQGTRFIGWDFKDAPLLLPEGQIYVLDLPVDRVFNRPLNGIKDGEAPKPDWLARVIWIDHHKTSIESHPSIPGYRIEGVAACRLAWQWFSYQKEMENLSGMMPCPDGLPDLLDYKDRRVVEPYAVQLAGEYDVWDKRNPDAETFQFGIKSEDIIAWDWLLSFTGLPYVEKLIGHGHMLQRYQRAADAKLMANSFITEFEGLRFLALNTTLCNSLTFASRDIPATGHDALLAFGELEPGKWKVSLYHASNHKDIDLSAIAKRYGGGGHPGACGFISATPPVKI